MKKKLNIVFMLNKEVLGFVVKEQEGLDKVKNGGFVRIYGSIPEFSISGNIMNLRGYVSSYDNIFAGKIYESEEEARKKRDFFIKAIGEELFKQKKTSVEDLKDGDFCYVRDEDDEEWINAGFVGKLRDEYYVELKVGASLVGFKQCKPRESKPDGEPDRRITTNFEGIELTSCIWEQED